MLIITHQSHLDHNLNLDHLRFILREFKDRDAFFLETVELPPELPSLPCSLRGPIMGQPAVLDIWTRREARPGREYPSRLLLPPSYDMTQPGAPERPLHDTHRALLEPLQGRLVTVIGGPAGDQACVLYTSFGGPPTPQEPSDPSLAAEKRGASEAFWAVHALMP